MSWNFSAGHYTATWQALGGSAASIGTTSDGFRVLDTRHQEEIRVDEMGDVVVDGVDRGISTVVELQYMEYSKMLPAMYAAYNSSNGSQGVSNASTGNLRTQFAGVLVLTPAGGTATGTTPWTFYHAIIDDTIPVLLANKVRQGPVRFFCYPDPVTGKSYAPGS